MKKLIVMLILLSGCSAADRVSVGGAVAGFFVGSTIAPPVTSVVGAMAGSTLGSVYEVNEDRVRQENFEPFESVI